MEAIYEQSGGVKDAEAKYNLGLIYYNGDAVPKDYREAVNLWSEAAEQGNSNSQLALGMAYRNGLAVEKDYAEAYKWFNLASTKNRDAEISRDSLEKEMFAQQIMEGQMRTRQWLDNHKRNSA